MRVSEAHACDTYADDDEAVNYLGMGSNDRAA
jgi:hypothetical protein